MKQIGLLAVLLLMRLSIADAEPMSDADIPYRYTSDSIEYNVNADGSFTDTQRWSTIVLKESALKGCKEASVTFSTSVAKGEILEAYTLKKSGKRIDAPKSSYQVSTNDGYASGSPLYSDETTITVMFPELAVGDTTVFAYRVTNREGMFRNQFSAYHVFSRFQAYDDLSIKIVAPRTMHLRAKQYFLTEQPVVEKGGKQIFQWTFRNTKPEKWTPADSGISVVGDEPSLYVSSFDSYRQIAEAYAKRAVPKAAVTERVKALAAQIVGDKKTPEARARALYDWVAKNITYGGNGIGIGAVVPRDLDVVLDNRMGDCKDHATLIQALFAAANIESEQALINTGDMYDLPPVPVVGAVNHVINYVPGMKLFLDSTASYVPFGMIPSALGEKPVLPVSHFREGAKVPSTAQYGHEQIMRTKIRINPDGTATGTTQISLKGDPAIHARYYMRRLRGDQEDYTVRSVLNSQGVHGAGTIQKDDPTELLDVYQYGYTFHLEDLIVAASTVGMPIQPVVSSSLPISRFVKGAYEPARKKADACKGGHSVEEYEYVFPASFTIVGYPKDFSFSSPAIDYTATYRKSGNSLVIKRELRDKTATNVCTPGYAEEFQKSARAIMRDIKAQVLLRD